ncbi:MAG: ribonuclease D [Cellvibrionaceae bacterium]|nr:ribonuclease D [Cellvibrionaceae bacterium]
MTADSEYEWVNTDARLQALCHQWSQQSAIAVDTEFARSHTFFPHIGLLQIADAAGIYLLDPLAFSDTQALKALLCNPDLVKVIHACSEDLEVFHHYLGVLPVKLFDTQIAAAFCHHGSSIAYAKLVSDLQGVVIPKQETRSDWLQRPLSPAQLRYAAVDVAHLLPIYQQLTAKLTQLQRTDWVSADCQQLLDRFEGGGASDRYFYRIKSAWTLKPRQLAVLKALCRWRDTRARAVDVPRNRIVTDSALFAMALSLPQTMMQLRGIEDLRARFITDFGERIIDCIQQALAATDTYPERLPAPLDNAGRDCLKSLKQTVNAVASSLCIPPEYLARKKDLLCLVRARDAADPPVLPDTLRGWRKPLIGDRLLAVLSEQP